MIMYTIVQAICIEYFFSSFQKNTGSVRIFKHMFHSLIREADTIFIHKYISRVNI